MLRIFSALACLSLLSLCSALGRAEEPKPRFEQRWFYAAFNLLVDKNADELIVLIRRAGKSGYNGMLLADYKLNKLGAMPKSYFQNVDRVKAAADEAGIEIIPCVFPIGYSEGLLAHDPNLAEGLPVVDAPFFVKGKQANLNPASAPRFVNGDLEETKGDKFVGFSFQDDPGMTTFADREIVHHGKASCRMQDVGTKSTSGNCRLIQRVKVRPRTAYRFSCWVKTKEFAPVGAFHLLAMTSPGGRSLTFHETSLKPTQDWTELEVTFNSLDAEEVNLYAGQWGGKSGTLWLDELKLEETGLRNVLRRAGCPLVVASANGKTVYEEGKDFQPIRDPKLGVEPYAGMFSFRHSPPSIQLTPDSRIKDGEQLRVSWYHPVSIHGEQMTCCLADPKVYELMRDQTRRVNDLFKPKTFMMSHDEIRVANWCKTCQDTSKTPGQLLADNVRRCSELIKEFNPKAKILVWNDMFDPHHNAVDKYYLVNGSWKDSWKGLPKDVVIVNWNSEKKDKSLKFFDERGHTQIIAGYYDSDVSNFKQWAAATKDMPRVTGFIYTTWQHKYGDLESFGKLMLGKE